MGNCVSHTRGHAHYQSYRIPTWKNAAMTEEEPEGPSLKNLTSRDFGKLKPRQLAVSKHDVTCKTLIRHCLF